jgi:type IV pilus assembly protein PilC
VQTYLWTGVNRQGRQISGETAAANAPLLHVELRRQGISPRKVRVKQDSIFTRKKNISPKEITLFLRQLTTMLGAGVPIVQSLDLIANGQKLISLQQLLVKIKTDIEAGNTLADSCRKHPQHFNLLLCNLIAAGEQSGMLDSMLTRIANYREKTALLASKVKKALIYPAAVIAVAILVTAILMVFVVPQFESLFKGFGADLPMVTKIVIQLSAFMQTYAGLLFSLVIIAITGFIQARKRSEKFAYLIDKALLRFPILGTVLTKAVIARFARTLATTFAAGLSIVDALKSASGATGNRVYAQTILHIRDSIATGQSLQTAMQTSQLFPPMALQLLMIGEESGTLENMLTKVADFYEAEVDTTVDNLSTLLEPAILVILGILVGGLVIAMYLPIFTLGKIV